MASETAIAVGSRGSPSSAKRRAWSIAALVVGFGAAFALAGLYAAFAVVALVAATIYVERPTARTRRAVQARRRRRRHRLACANIATDELDELTAIVDAALRIDATADAADLEELLERYGELAVARDRCADVASRAPIIDLARRRDHAARNARRRHVRVLARRIAWSRRCEAWLAHFDDQLAEVAGLIRAYVDHATRPHVDFLLDEDVVTARLERLDAIGA
jgi:hypothetical protein